VGVDVARGREVLATLRKRDMKEERGENIGRKRERAWEGEDGEGKGNVGLNST
jgi:hypothetical protein